ncbi:MAG TPA: hypothetical protein GX510_02510 [Firmicutes bacterium]|nr:hypothetical protein [Candidatus Fermentithermobacillaceae bacterium]
MNMNSRHIDEYTILRKIAALVMENPNITVREIAQKLGYAEEKSVYYWLEKAKFAGIKDFKKAVLTGAVSPGFLAGDGKPKAPLKDGTSLKDALSLVDLPVRGHFPVRTPGEKPLSQYLPIGFAPGSYLVPADEDLAAGTVRKGDLLLVDPSSPIQSGDLVMAVSEAGEPQVLRRYTTPQGDEVFVDLAEPGRTTSPATVAGKIILLIRIAP